MKKERFKSFILILLICANFVFSAKILVDKKLWLSGYNFFVSSKTPAKGANSVSSSLFKPIKIVVNTGYQSSRYNYTRASDYFSTIENEANSLLKKAFLEKNSTNITEEEWFSALGAKSVYLSYPTAFSSSVFSDFLGISSSDFNFTGFSDIVISESGTVYINDLSGFYKIYNSSAEISPIIQKVSSENDDTKPVINYSYDLNFDKGFADQKTFLSPLILIYSDSISAPSVTSTNPVMKSADVYNDKAVSGILSAFSINPKTVNRYTEADGSLVFVENNGILKISLNGMLTYTATGNGISISSAGDLFSESSHLASFIDSLNLNAGIVSDMYITSPMSLEETDTFSFDYLVGGFPVKYDVPAISAVVRDGHLVSYSQLLRAYSPVGFTTESPIFIEALDEVTEKYRTSLNEMHITNMYPAYIDNKEICEKNIDWFVDIDDVVAE